MALPDIAGYLASTRQPLDLVGPAIQAFQAVSAEMRATRAQNLAEEESARDLGKGIKEGMQKDRMFQEDLIDKAQMREIRKEDQGFERARLSMEQQRFGMDLARHQFAQENLWGLEVQAKQMDILRDKQFYDAKALEIQNEKELRLLGSSNLQMLSGVINGTVPVAEEAIDREAGEDENSPLARMRMANSMFEKIGSVTDAVGDPALKATRAMLGMKIQADPSYRDALNSGKLMLPGERAAQAEQRRKRLMAELPGDDAWSERFMTLNQKAVTAMDTLPPEDAEAIYKTLIDRAKSNAADPTRKQAQDMEEMQSVVLGLAELDGKLEVFPRDTGDPAKFDEMTMERAGLVKKYQVLSQFTGMDPLSLNRTNPNEVRFPTAPATSAPSPPSTLGAEMKTLLGE